MKTITDTTSAEIVAAIDPIFYDGRPRNLRFEDGHEVYVTYDVDYNVLRAHTPATQQQPRAQIAEADCAGRLVYEIKSWAE